jgi:hypothetical protein
LKKLFKSLIKQVDIKDAFTILGAFLMSKGLYMIYHPLSYIVIGLALIWMGLPRKAVK